MRNAPAPAAPRQRPAVIAVNKTIFAQATREAAHRQWEQVADALLETFSRLADMMGASREDVLACLAFPREHRAQIASTNRLEGVNKQIKRRANVIGTSPNSAAIMRLVCTPMLEQNDEWSVSRRHMTLATIGSASPPSPSCQPWPPDPNPILPGINGSCTTPRGNTPASPP
nr:transposase [Thermaurantiacus tibetensis]